MAAIRFLTTLNGGMTLLFTRNPSFPRASVAPTPAAVVARTADGPVHHEYMGEEALVTLTWPEGGPMTTGDYYSGAANLRGFYVKVRGLPFSFRDDDGATTYDASFVDEPQFQEVAQGFAGSITLRTFVT